MPVPSRCLEDLDTFAACGLAALAKSRDLRRPVTPTRAMTIRVLEALQARGIVAVPWPQPRWELPPRGHLAPIEQLGWDYVWPALTVRHLLAGVAAVKEGFVKFTPEDVMQALLASGYLRLEWVRARMTLPQEAA